MIFRRDTGPHKVVPLQQPDSYLIGDRVKIVPLENCPGRVLRIEKDRDGWQIVVRYFQDGVAKTENFYPDEVELLGADNLEVEHRRQAERKLAALPAAGDVERMRVDFKEMSATVQLWVDGTFLLAVEKDDEFRVPVMRKIVAALSAAPSGDGREGKK